MTAFDQAYVGVCYQTNKKMYNSQKCIDILEKSGMEPDEALYHFNNGMVGCFFNILWVEDRTACI